MQPSYYVLLPSAFGNLAIVWQETKDGPRTRRVLLPKAGVSTERTVQTCFLDARRLSCPEMAELAQQVTRFLDGEPIVFSVDTLMLATCSEFQQKVLRLEHQIPRGWVSTYGRIAKRLGMPGAARAVGSALSRNPFPILIPCHRAICAGGELGGFQGGLDMKKALLEMEGVVFTSSGKVLTSRFYY